MEMLQNAIKCQAWMTKNNTTLLKIVNAVPQSQMHIVNGAL
jgi:hypothetical protein